MPERNEVDTEEIPEDVRRELEIIPAKRISDVIAAALETEPTAAKPENYVIHDVEPHAEGTNERLIAKEK